MQDVLTAALEAGVSTYVFDGSQPKTQQLMSKWSALGRFTTLTTAPAAPLSAGARSGMQQTSCSILKDGDNKEVRGQNDVVSNTKLLATSGKH